MFNYSSQCVCGSEMNYCLQVLSIIQPPYSAEFGSVFLPLVQNQDIAGPLINAEATDLVSQFIGTECLYTSELATLFSVFSTVV